MTEKKEATTYIPQAFIDLIDDHFLEAARYLREIYDESPDQFGAVAKSLGIKPRKAYHLLQIDRSFSPLGIPEARLRKIGWTKLSILAPQITEANAEELMTLAETMRAHDLKLCLRGEFIGPDSRAVVIYLDHEQHKVFEQAMVKAGAIRNNKGLLNKDAALIKIMLSFLSL